MELDRRMRQMRCMMSEFIFSRRNTRSTASMATDMQEFNGILSPVAKKSSSLVVLPLWVRLLVHFDEPLDAVVHINLRGCEVRVTEQFFNGVQIRAVIGEMRGERMAQHMRASLLDRSHGGKIFSDDVVDVFG